MAEHGTRACYASGCRRIVCIDANAEYQRAYRASAAGVTRERRRSESKGQQRAQVARDQAALFAD